MPNWQRSAASLIQYLCYVFILLACGSATVFADVGDSYLKKGNQFYRQGQWEKAIEQYHLVLKINPENLAAMQNLGLAYQSKKDYGRAIETFCKIKKIDGLFVPAYISLGLVYAQKGCYDDSQHEYRQAIVLEPNNLVAHLNLAAVLAKQKKFAQAIRAARRGLKVSPSNPHLHLVLANIYCAKQKYSLAVRELKKVLHLQPQTPVARIMLAMALAHAGRFEEALSQMQIAKDLNSPPSEITYHTGKILALRFRAEQTGWKEAVDQLRAAANFSPDDIEIVKELADLLVAKSQYTEARKWYRRILENPKVSVQERLAIDGGMKAWPKEKENANVSSKL